MIVRNHSTHVGRPAVAALAVASSVLALAACGSSSSTTSQTTSASPGTTSSGTTTATAAASTGPAASSGAISAYSGSAALTAQARADALKDAATAGPAVKLPAGKTIGIVELSGQSATSQRIVAAAKQIGSLLNYKVITCDPNFDPTKVPQCATSILAQNPSMMISVSQNPGPMGSAVPQAAQRQIPWFDVATGITPTHYIYNYGENGTTLAHTLDNWLFPAMAAAKGNSAKLQLMALAAPTVGYGLQAGQQLAADIKADPKVDLVVNHDLDLSNPVQDTLNTTTTSIQHYPNLAGALTGCDVCIPLIAQALDTAGVTGSKRPLVAGEYSSPQTIADIRKGTVNAVADYPWETAVWVAMDQSLEHWARGKTIAPAFNPATGATPSVYTTAYSLKMMQPYVLTKANAGSSGPIPIYGPDFQTYFETKWKKEFGVG